METLFGLLLALIGIPLFVLGVRMFIKSDGWFYLTKAALVTIIGLIMFVASLDPLGF
jgi:hypothetical protein